MRGVLKVKILEQKYKAKLGFPGKGEGAAKQKTFHGRSMDTAYSELISCMEMGFHIGVMQRSMTPWMELSSKWASGGHVSNLQL